MITTTQSRLLTACVDGELSAGQQLAADRLLQQSAEARALLRQMQEDAAKVRDLPRRRLDPAFAGRIVQALTRRRFPLRRPVHSGQRSIPAWVGLAAAASVVLAISTGTYFYFASLSSGTDRSVVAHRNEKPAPTPVEDSKHDQNPADKTDIAKVAPRDTPKQPDETPIDHGPNDSSTAKKNFVGPPEPSEATTEPALAYPIDKMEMFKAQVADVQQPLILKMRDFEADKLKAEAKKDQAFRLELPSRDSAKAFARIETAFKAHGVTLVIDQVAQKRLKQPKAKTNFVFYVDDLTPEELTAVLKQLSDDDKAAESKHKGDGLFEAIVVNRMSDGDHKELTQLLGVDPRPSKPAPADPKKPLSETTADQVAKTISNPASKGAERLAIALAYNPERPRPNSAEVKRFLEGRKPARAATVQVLLVLRET
jgi:hypothetical protein